tara:strand:+ start:183 stop:968 length:786 start_codon:yes stop_codon:yes gene_type:complete
MHFADVEIGKRLFLGEGRPIALGIGDDEIRGSAYMEGPVQMGTADAFSSVLGTLMIGREKNSDDKKQPPRSLYVKGNTFMEGDDGTADALVVEGDQTINSGDLHDSNLLNCTGQNVNLTSSTINVQGWKGFDIIHPSKKGYRLRHICLEGPEGGVYVRGKVKNDKIILLPDYWKNLVDINSITVQLQPIGAHQDIIVKRWDAEKIELQSKPGIPIHCFYHIFAERIDGEQLVVEYKGETPDEYPGDNTQYSIAGYHYDTRN